METLRGEKAINTANLLTAIRIALLPAIVFCFKNDDMNGALVLYVVSMLTDVADGFVARRFNQKTSIGKLLDPAADKLSLLVMLSLFVLDGQIPFWILAVILFKEIGLIIGSGVALHHGIVVSALPIGKASTLFFVLSNVLRLLRRRLAADWVLCVSLLLSLAAFVWYFVVAVQSIKPNNTLSTK